MSATAVHTEERCVGVMGRGTEYILLDILGELDVKDGEDAAAKGYFFCGTLGFKDGAPTLRCEPFPGCHLPMACATMGFMTQIAGIGSAASKGDSVPWLHALHTLLDTREVPRA